MITGQFCSYGVGRLLLNLDGAALAAVDGEVGTGRWLRSRGKVLVETSLSSGNVSTRGIYTRILCHERLSQLPFLSSFNSIVSHRLHRYHCNSCPSCHLRTFCSVHRNSIVSHRLHRYHCNSCPLSPSHFLLSSSKLDRQPSPSSISL
jgi:hypothetical protein